MAAHGGDRGSSSGLSGMSTAQIYDVMSQMKMLVDQNKQQARLILTQNPSLTRALFQAQVMLGMVQPPQATPTATSTTPQNSRATTISNQERNQQPIASNPQTRPISPPNLLPLSNPILPPNRQVQSLSPQLSQPVQQPTGHLTSQPTPVSITPPSAQIPGLTQFPQHSSPKPLPRHKPTLPPSSTPQSQQPKQNRQYMPLQQHLPRPPQIPAFSHPGQHQLGPNSGFQHPSGLQMQPPQQIFHPGTKPSSGAGPSFRQGQIPHSNQPLPPSLYQAGSPRMGVEFNQGGSSKQPDRGSSWMTTGPPADNATGTQIPGLQPSFPGQMGITNQPARPSSLNPEMERALLQQVMSLTPEQINMLPTDQRNQILQLQQMLRQ